ncbi:MAG: hypothetical protein OQK58_11520 [Gammaproteobacteria bacterium]|nr:hypothetical protein [Gammaproteobacteria bacterium]
MDDETFKNIEQQFIISEARFDVADDLGWATGFFAGIAVYLKWHSWIAAIVFGFVIFYIASYRERKNYNKVKKLYEGTLPAE